MVRYVGEVVAEPLSRPAQAVAVDFIRTGGAVLRSDTLRAVSDDNGRFEIIGEAESEGSVVGDLVFYLAEPIGAARFAGVTLQTSRAGGNLLYAGKWEIPYPHLPYEASFYHRGSGRPAAGVEVEFRRTGGIAVEPDTFRVTTDIWGAVKLRPETQSVGELVGEIEVFPTPPHRPYVIRNLRMPTFLTPRNDSTIVRSGLGAYFPYAGVLVWAESGEAAGGVVLEFRRRSGIQIAPSPFTTETDRFGTFHLNPLPVTEGDVEGELVITSPAALAGTVVAELTLSAATEDTAVRHLGYFGIPRS